MKWRLGSKWLMAIDPQNSQLFSAEKKSLDHPVTQAVGSIDLVAEDTRNCQPQNQVDEQQQNWLVLSIVFFCILAWDGPQFYFFFKVCYYSIVVVDGAFSLWYLDMLAASILIARFWFFSETTTGICTHFASCVYKYIHIWYIYTYIYIYMSIDVDVCIYLSLYIHICIYIYIYLPRCMYIYTNVYIVCVYI